MAYVFQRTRFFSFPRLRSYILAMLWPFGFLAGCLFYLSARSIFSPLMCGAVIGSVSIVSLLFCTLFPFLISAFAVFLSCPWLLILVGFCKSFLFGFLSLGLVLAFGGGGWFLRFLVLSADILTFPLLFWYLHRNLLTISKSFLEESALVISLALLMGIANYVYILPFLADL